MIDLKYLLKDGTVREVSEYCTVHLFDEDLDYSLDGHMRADVQEVTFTADLRTIEKYGRAVRMSRWAKHFDIDGTDISLTWDMSASPIRTLFLLSLIRPLEEDDWYHGNVVDMMQETQYLSASKFVILVHALRESDPHMTFQPLNRIGGIFNHLDEFDKIIVEDDGPGYEEYSSYCDADGSAFPQDKLYKRLTPAALPKYSIDGYDIEEMKNYLNLPTHLSSFKGFVNGNKS